MTTLAEYEKMLDEAKAALHSLAVGTKTVEVTFPSGQSVRYSSANSADLRRYIAELEDTIKGLGGTVQRMPNRRALRFGF